MFIASPLEDQLKTQPSTDDMKESDPNTSDTDSTDELECKE